jgi:hypothetical protein
MRCNKMTFVSWYFILYCVCAGKWSWTSTNKAHVRYTCHRTGGTLLAFSMIHVCLQWQELAWDLSRLALFKYSYSRDMRFSTDDLSSTYLIFVLTLTLTTQDAYDGGNASSKLVSNIIFGRFIKTCNHSFPLQRAFLLLLCWVFTVYLYAAIKRE